VIVIPERVWAEMLEVFHSIPGKVERVAYMDGVETEAQDVVTTLTVPDAVLEPVRFTVTAEAMSEAGAHLRRHGLVRLLQVHTHPAGIPLDHSGWDDLRAYSQRVGALSLVLPWPHPRPLQLLDAAVHLRERVEWRRLDSREASGLLRLVPSLIDRRR
jgi:hypothetical protein